MMEARIIEYPRSDYQHNSSPLIGEIPNNDYTHFHRSIDQLRSLNERGILNSNHFQNVLVPSSTSSIVVQASGVYSEIKLSEDSKVLNDYQSTNKLLRREEDKDSADVTGSNFRIIHSPQEYSIAVSPTIQQNGFVAIESEENQIKGKVRKMWEILKL
jgi:hypothetical protein